VTPGSEADAERVAALALAEDGPRDVTSDITVAPAARAAWAVPSLEPLSTTIISRRSSG